MGFILNILYYLFAQSYPTSPRLRKCFLYLFRLFKTIVKAGEQHHPHRGVFLFRSDFELVNLIALFIVHCTPTVYHGPEIIALSNFPSTCISRFFCPFVFHVRSYGGLDPEGDTHFLYSYKFCISFCYRQQLTDTPHDTST